MTRRAEYRNEVKTRLEDDVYEALQDFKQLNYIDSDSAALARIVRMLLCGIVPRPRAAVSSETGRIGPRERV
jgi:hypothetical protein